MMQPSRTSSRPAHTCGFRMSALDALILVAGGAAGWMLWAPLGSFALLFPFIVAHFFLFCNGFRVRRSYELIWAAAFVANFAVWTAAGEFSWWSVLLTQAPVTVAVIAAEVMSSRYHGIGCRCEP